MGNGGRENGTYAMSFWDMLSEELLDMVGGGMGCSCSSGSRCDYDGIGRNTRDRWEKVGV